MPLLSREALPSASLPEQEVEVEALGGALLLRGLDLPGLLAFHAERRRASAPLDGETPEEAANRAGAHLMPWLLARTALASDGQPAYTEAQWRIFGVRHPGAMAELFVAAMGVSGGDLAAEKKT